MADDDNASDRSWLLDNSTDASGVARQYDDWAGGYDEELETWGYRSPVEAAKLLARYAAPAARVLDAGCGTGLAGEALATLGFRNITGLDISAESVKLALGRGVYESVHEGDLQQPLPFADKTFDALTCVGVLTYVEEVAATFREFCRLVRPGGHIVFTSRDDLYFERNYDGLVASLVQAGSWRQLHRSAPGPYLPNNEDFGDSIRVIYCAFEVLQTK